jgi:hypothetical protein
MSEILSLSLKDLQVMRTDFEEQYNSLFGMAKQRLLRLLKIKCLAIKHIKVHHSRMEKRIEKELNETNSILHMDKQEQETKMKILIQEKVEPVDIREVDEDSMMWTLNGSIDHENFDSVASQEKPVLKKKTKTLKTSIFCRTNEEKIKYLQTLKTFTDEKNEEK